MKPNYWPVLIGTALLTACGAAGGASAPAAAPAASTSTLTAVKVDAATLDAAAAYWANAPKLEVATKAAEKDKPDGPKIMMQAVYDGSNLVVRAEWPDTTESLARNVWTYDGKAFKRGGEQDRFALTFPMNNNAEFASKGCGVACHSNDPDKATWWMGSEKADVKYDTWQWQSAQINPVGQADDQWWGPKDPITATSGRKNDANDGGGPKSNTNKDNTMPSFMNGKALDAKFIMAGEEVPLDVSKLAANAVIPGYVLAPWKGSRGDVSAKAVWSNGKWVLVMSRALNTSHDDDVVFTPSKPLPFGMAVFDNSGDLDHTIVQDVLTLAWK